ncbi:2-dehydro-3-deoxyglucarate aldolase [Fulvivirgaceae bacterium PWU4]|uniref:2-dehydro-3-deoxyglucarate aldolase n=1 Tax=Chryseosolibacter histidini TaxID=2782349 RepID=A0AAP2DPT7_9BACT|nr:aldolase/citrate lyase family protein [Chryseosolibacter histidini]MBT1698099.1 2-dehydro-3-deoxyglucarate aldolase [Chryseosolibacter histidini]
MKNLKKRLKQGETLHGCWLNLGSAVTAEIVGRAGFDWVLIDLEHGAGEEKDVMSQLQALEHSNTAALVRVESAAGQRIHRVLDMGAEGIMCPHINNGREAAMVAKGLHYPPAGTRGVAKMVRATGFGQHFAEYYASATENILGIVQIETAQALDHLDEIAAVPNIDVLFIGPADLSMDLGIFGQFDHPRFKDALRATVNAAQKAGKATGILFFNPDDYTTYHQLGIRFIGCGADATFVADGSRAMAARMQAMRSTHNAGKP